MTKDEPKKSIRKIYFAVSDHRLHRFTHSTTIVPLLIIVSDNGSR